MNDSKRCLFDIVAKPHHASEAYSIFATITDLKMTFNASSHIPWHRRTFIAYSDWAYLLMTLDTCSVTDRRFEIMTPSMHGDRCYSGDTWQNWWITISNVASSLYSEYDFQLLSYVRLTLLQCAHCSTWSISTFRDWTLAGITVNVLSAYTLVQSISGCDSTRQLRWWCMTQDRPLTLVQCWQWCLI